MKCKNCQCEFLCDHGNMKYCSRRCGDIFNAVKFENECPFCKLKYTGRKSQKFCSKSCSAANRSDHLNKIQQTRRKYPNIEGLNRVQIFRKFNPEKERYELDKDKIKRVILIQYLGGKCCKCGYDADIRALQLDHINGDGYLDRKKVGRVGKIYRHYVKNLVESVGVLQVLCANCHAIKTFEKNEYCSPINGRLQDDG